MDSVVSTLLVPQTHALVQAQAALTDALVALEQAPSEEALRTAREAWRPAALAWERASVLRIGPLAESRALLRCAFWPVRSAKLLQLSAAEPAPGDADVERLGVDVRGLFALEWLLFAPHDSSLSSSARERALASVLARNILSYARTAEHELGTAEHLRAQLSRDENTNFSRLVHMLIASVELLTKDRLAPSAHTRGDSSRSTAVLITAQLMAASALYDAVQPLVEAAAPAIHTHLSQLFRATETQARAYEQDPSARRATHDAMQTLERALKAELPSALGLTLTFEAGDAD